MTGYRPDDDWSQQTTDSGEPISGSWRVILAFAGVLAVIVAVGLVGKFSLGRTVCLLFAVAFSWISAISAQRLWVGVQDYYFEARQFGRIYRAESPINYWLYFSLYALMLPIGLGVAVASAAAVYFDPFAH